MRNLLILSALVTVAAANASTLITQWNFNGTSTTTVPGGGSSPTAATGTGTASLFGGAVGSFASGTSNGGSSDPVTTTPNNYGWGTTTYNSPLTATIQRGVAFAVPTNIGLGFTNIMVRFDRRHSNTSSKWLKFEYTLDGTTYTSAGLANDGITSANGGDTWVNGTSFNLSSIAGAANNANFGFRIGPVLSSTGAAEAANPTSTYAAGGTLRYDMVSVSGEPVPEPGTMLALGAGLAMLARRRRKQ